jgi:type I restriction enzyme S subunit
MEKYTYKESGIEWLGNIPKHWKVTSLKRVLSEALKYGANESAELEDKNLPRYIRITDFGNNGKLKENTFKSLPIEKAIQYPLSEGDILFARSGATVGKTFQFKNYKGKACYAGYLIKATPCKWIIDSDFLFFFTKSIGYEEWKNLIFTQATIQNIGADKYQYLPLSVPPLKEQKAIVEYLDKATVKIDRIISIKQEQLVKMGDYYDSRIHEYITKGINKSDFIESGIDWQGEVPKHWNKEKLFRLADKMGSGGTPKSTNQDYYGGHISWIQSGDLNDWIVSTTKKTITEEALNNSSAKMFKKGTLLIAMYGATIGKLGVMGMDSATNQACCAIQVGSKLNSDFLFYLLYDMRKFLISQGYGGGQQNISQETLKQQYFYYPEKKEQIEIVNQIKDFRSKQEIIRENVKSQIETLQAYRKNLIHECVTGKKQIAKYTLN